MFSFFFDTISLNIAPQNKGSHGNVQKSRLAQSFGGQVFYSKVVRIARKILSLRTRMYDHFLCTRSDTLYIIYTHAHTCTSKSLVALFICHFSGQRNDRCTRPRAFLVQNFERKPCVWYFLCSVGVGSFDGLSRSILFCYIVLPQKKTTSNGIFFVRLACAMIINSPKASFGHLFCFVCVGHFLKTFLPPVIPICLFLYLNLFTTRSSILFDSSFFLLDLNPVKS